MVDAMLLNLELRRQHRSRQCVLRLYVFSAQDDFAVVLLAYVNIPFKVLSFPLLFFPSRRDHCPPKQVI